MNKYKKKICVITSGRADYGLLKNLIKKINASKKIDYHLSITGTHLSSKHGETFKEILSDKLKINSRVKIFENDDSEIGISKSFSIGVTKFSKLFKKIRPSLILVLGDKFEIFSSVIAATFNRIPIAHIYGGEETTGAIDNVIRNSITKMSHIHFTATKKYQKRIIQMGENPKFVFNVGAMGIEDFNNIKFRSKKYFKKKYNINFDKKTILVCFHPVTLEPNTEKKHIKSILFSLKHLKDTNIVFTSPNADHGYKQIDNEIKKFSKNKKNCFYIKSFGRTNFLSCLKLSNIIIGNSSSGIIEAPSLKTITINIGDRQKGRVKSKSIINCNTSAKNIKRFLDKYLNKRFETKKNFYYNEHFKKNSSKKILKVLENINTQNLIKKPFVENFNL